ncbi:hypothetical protein [Microbispora sp. NPDC049125]|uniref:hypothetical protein n=1 Tax=Microbispora sp. NPDC049125 TaxID=3154929 RepID=UPI003465F27E
MALGGVLAAGVLGCTPQVNGEAGISVDEAGRLLLVFAWCGRGPSSAVVYHDRQSGSAPDEIRDARYEGPEMKGRSGTIRLDAPSGGWTATIGPPKLTPAITYTAVGGNGDASTATGSISFEAGDAAKLKPGKVLVQRYDQKQQVVAEVIPMEQFQRSARWPATCT